MKGNFTKINVAELLKTEEAALAFLRESWKTSLEEDDPDYFVGALAVVARSRGLSRVARETGLDRENLRKALSPGYAPPFSTIAKIMHILGIQLEETPINTKIPFRGRRMARGY